MNVSDLPTPEPGLLLAVEGIDGAGKTTQLARLAALLRELGLSVVTSREPTSGPHGQRIRRSATSGRLSVEEELEAFTQDRTEHVRDVVAPALAAGKIVLLDRYFYSTIAYQGSRGASVADIDRKMKGLFPTPAMVFVLDLDPATAIRRIAARDGAPNHFERVDSLTAVRAVFNDLCDGDPRLWKIDGGLPEDAVHTTIANLAIDHSLRERLCAAARRGEPASSCAHGTPGSCPWWDLQLAASRVLARRETPALRSRPAPTP